MADRIVSWGGFDSKSTSGMGVTGSFQVSSSANSFFVGGGNIGINTTTPSANLQIYGLSNKLYFQSPTTNQGGHAISFGFGGNGEQVKLIANASGGGGAGLFYIAAASGDTAVATTSDANLAISTTNTTLKKIVTIDNNVSGLTYPGLFISGYQPSAVTSGIYFTYSETRVAILSKPHGGSGYADFRIAIVPLGSSTPNNPPQESDTKFMITKDTTNVLINTTTDSGGKLTVKGSGATSSTTSLLVQNANASASFQVKDNSEVVFATPDYSPTDQFGTFSFLSKTRTGIYIANTGNNYGISYEGGQIYANIGYSGGNPKFTPSNNRWTTNADFTSQGNTVANNFYLGTNGGYFSAPSSGTDLYAVFAGSTSASGQGRILMYGETHNPKRGKLELYSGTDPVYGVISFLPGNTEAARFTPDGRLNIGAITGSAKVLISGSSNSTLLEIDSPVVNNILYVSGSGNIGIGKSNPTYKLDVNGTINTGIGYGNFTTYSPDAQFGAAYVGEEVKAAIVTARSYPATYAGVTIPGFSSALVLGTSYGYDVGTGNYIISVGDLNVRVNNTTQALYANTSGQIGVGFSGSLSARLHVKGSGTTSSTTSLLVQNANASSSLQVKDDLTTTFGGSITIAKTGNNQLAILDTPSIEYRYNQGGSGGQRINFGFYSTTFNFVPGSETLGGNASFGIRVTGSSTTTYAFGIINGNNTNPETEFRNAFDLDGNLYFRNDSTIRAISTTFSNGGTLNIQGGQPRSDVPNGNGGTLSLNGGLGLGTGTPGDIILKTSTTGSSGTTPQSLTSRVWIKGQTGFVGIGTSSPSASLHVSGSSIFTNTVTISGSNAAVTMPSRPAFRVTGSGTMTNLTTTQNGDGTLNQNNWVIDYQQGSALTGSTGVFTAPLAGLYQISLVGRNSGYSSGISQLAVVKYSGASSAVQIMVEWASSSTMNHTGGSSITYMNVGDTLKLKVLAGEINFDGNDNWSVAYIG